MDRGKVLTLQQIDTSFDFTSDCRYWEDFWNGSDLIGCGKVDPDSASKTLKQYHKLLWSKRLPNGEEMLLEAGGPYDYLNTEDGLRLSSDTISRKKRMTCDRSRKSSSYVFLLFVHCRDQL